MVDKEITNAEIPGCPPGEVRGRRRTMRLLAVTGVTMFILLVIVILFGYPCPRASRVEIAAKHQRSCRSRGNDHPPQAESADR